LIVKSVLTLITLTTLTDVTHSRKKFSNDESLRLMDPDFVEDRDTTALWYGDISERTIRQKREIGINKYKVTMVISHCDKPIDWIWRDYIPDQFHIQNAIVYSKCGNAVEGAPDNTTIIQLPNVGRCDHTYAYHMEQLNFTDTPSKDEIIVFIKDNPRRMNQTRSLETLLHIASVNGFSCIEQKIIFEDMRPSYYHDYSKLSKFALGGWAREKRDKNDKFESKYDHLGDWVDQLNITLPSPLIPVCYGGVFAATASQISKKKTIWSSIEKSLSRGDNIEEGHFCERVWAGLLSKPLSKYAKKIIQEKSTETMWDNGVFCGTLAYRETFHNERNILSVNLVIVFMYALFRMISKRDSRWFT